MRVELWGDEHPDFWEGLLAPDGRRYRQKKARTTRKAGDQLIAAGAPLVLYYWAGGQLDWCDGQDAIDQWQVIRPHVVNTEPRPTSRRLEWTVGRWETDDGEVIVVLIGHC